MNTDQKTSAVTVVTKEQGGLIDQSKALLTAHATAEKSTHVYLFALGARLHALKATCEHGGFEKLKAANFPDAEHSKLGRAMTFADAIGYFAKGKYPIVGFLGQGELALTNGVIPEKDFNKAVAELDEITKGMGVVETIKKYREKTAPKPAPVDAVKKEEEHQRAINQSLLDAIAALEFVMQWKEADYALSDKANRTALAAACVRFGKHQKAFAKSQKLDVKKAAK